MSLEDDAIQDVRDFCAKAWTEYREQAPMHEILRMSTLLPFLLNRIDAQAEQIATLKEIATNERVKYNLLFPECWNESDRNDAATLARQQLEAEYPEVMR